MKQALIVEEMLVLEKKPLGFGDKTFSLKKSLSLEKKTPVLEEKR